MKATIQTLLSRAAEPADLEFEDYDNDGTRELLIKSFRVAELGSHLEKQLTG
jgi:hypothetical protein